MMLKYRIHLVLTLASLIFTGCYTIFLKEKPSAYPEKRAYSEVADSVVVPDSSLSGKNTQISEKTRDTLIIREREVCTWQRNLFGEWELRCYDTKYSSSWYRYYNYPWWYNDWYEERYYLSTRCHCPYHRRFHSGCELCWRYCDRYFREHHEPPYFQEDYYYEAPEDKQKSGKKRVPLPPRRRLRDESGKNSLHSPENEASAEIQKDSGTSDTEERPYASFPVLTDPESKTNQVSSPKKDSGKESGYSSETKGTTRKDSTSSENNRKNRIKPPKRRRLR